MIFKRIRIHIAAQFTAFVFMLLLINGAIFLALDLSNARRQSHLRMQEFAQRIVEQMETDTDESSDAMMPPPPRGMGAPQQGRMQPMRDRFRILDTAGKTLEGGSLFADIPFTPIQGITRVEMNQEEYTMITQAIFRDGAIAGYVQVVGLDRFQRRELPMRILLYLLVSGAISALTFFVGLLFARRSLKPAEETMERLEQFTQDASHELKTPLATMSSSLDLALKTGKFQEGLLSAKEDLIQATTLVERLLELARLDKLIIKNDNVDFSDLVRESAERFRPLAAEKYLKIETQVDPTVSVKGDAALLRQVMGNLINNAIKFSKTSGGTIRVRLTKHTLTVEDQGIGIADDALPHIFDRFYQADTSRAHGGFGLGLALVKRIVELHGWTIEAQRSKESGAVLAVRMG